MRVRGIPHSPHALLVDLGTKVHSEVELLLWLVRLIDVPSDLTLHEPSRVVDGRIDNAVLDRLGDDVLGVLLRVEVELERHVPERDARVGEGDGSEGGLDDEMAESEDEEVGRVGKEGLLMRGECLLEGRDVANANS
jgi:hypothetical protein